MVIGLDQVCLGAASHFSDVPDRGERHEKNFALT
jgi:hypothetical protein